MRMVSPLLCAWALLVASTGVAQVKAPRAMTPTRALGPKRAPVVPANLEKTAREALYQRYKSALARELGLLQSLDTLDQQTERIDKRLGRLAAQRAEVTESLRAAEVRRAESARRLQRARVSVRARLRALLRLRRVPELRFLLSAESFAQSVVKARVLRKLVGADQQRLERYREHLATLLSETRSRDDKLADLAKVNDELHAQRVSLQTKRHDKEALLGQIRTDPIYNDHARRDMDAANVALRDKIKTLSQWLERRYPFGRLKGKVLPPLSRYVLEVPFGPNRHPVFGTSTWHRGIDLRVPGGATGPVRSVSSGRVAHVGWLTGYGDTVILDHGRGWHTVYAHLESIQVEVGEVVRPRQRLAMVGASGSLKGRYLYFEVRENGRAQNPSHWFR